MSTTLSDTVQNIQNICLDRNIPFVSYCLPNQTSTNTLIQYLSDPVVIKSLQNIEQKKGFLIAPFAEKPEFPVYFLEPDIVFSDKNPQENCLEILRQIPLKKDLNDSPREYYIASREEFMGQVKEITGTIRKGEIDKVVLSRVHLVKNENAIGAPVIFEALCQKYPKAFKYIFNLPGTGCWLGATPEPLVEIKDHQVETVSLAGTQKLNGIPVEEVQWMAKELVEQKFVTDFIEQRLSRFGIQEYQKVGPVNQQAANLVHLKSVFTFPREALSGRLGEFISLLHPTPSICGLPRRKSYEYIKKLEGHKREYYSGYLGTVNMDNSSYIYVNLRCMKVLEKQFALFTGAGITGGSDPESEWEETGEKMMTMLNVINSLSHS